MFQNDHKQLLLQIKYAETINNEPRSRLLTEMDKRTSDEEPKDDEEQ